MRGQSWISTWSLFFLCCSLSMISGVSETFAQESKRAPQPLQPGELQCFNSQKKIRPVTYTLAVMVVDLGNKVNSPKPQPPGKAVVEGGLVVFVKDKNENVYPIIIRTSSDPSLPRYQALCSPDPKKLAGLPTKLEMTSNIAKALIIDRLKAISREPWNELSQYGAVPLWFNGTRVSFILWPHENSKLPSSKLLVTLIEKYFAQGKHTILVPGTDHIDVTALVSGKRIPWLPAIAQVPNGESDNAANSQRQQLPNQTQAPEIPSLQTQAPALAPPTGGQLARSDPVPFTVGFQNSAPWKDVILNEDKRISSYGYCEDDQIVRDPKNFSYTLQCKPGEDGKVPIGIRGFQVVLVSRQEAKQIDTTLEVVGFRRAYPPSWGRVSSALVEVPSGPLAQVLRTNLTLDQGIPDASPCTSTIPVSVVSIVDQSIGIEELPPCRRYQLRFQENLPDETAQVLSGCVAGLSVSRPIQQSQVTCWYHRSQSTQISLSLQMRAGFMQLPIKFGLVKLDEGPIYYDFNALAAQLVPRWPYRGASPYEETSARGEAPPQFSAKSVQYFERLDKPCDRPLPVNNRLMPNLRDARCQQVPVQAVVTFVKGPAVSQGAPPNAFHDSPEDRYDIRSVVSAQRSVDVSIIKRALHIKFDQESVDEYRVRFRTANASAPASLHVFPGTGERCGRPAAGTFVPFENPDIKKTFKWPQVGAVYGVRGRDSIDQPILTECAPARVVERDGHFHLTFDLDAKIANGPRRVVIVANSVGLQQGGTADQVREGLRRLVDLVDAERGKRAPLSPISVYFMDSKEDLQALFTGEDAAKKPAEAKGKLLGIDRAAPQTPDLNLLRQQPEIRDNIDRLIIIMDGSVPIDENITQAGGFARRLGAGCVVPRVPGSLCGSLTIFIKGNCQKWDPDVNRIECLQLTSQPQSIDQLTKVLSALVERRETRAGESVAPRK